MRARLGHLASRAYPGLDEMLWNRRRQVEMTAEIAAGGYLARLADLPSPSVAPPPRHDLGRASHLVVVPQVGPDVDTWAPAGGNFFYEIAQAAREYAGVDKVTIFPVSPDEPAAEWHIRLIRHLVESGATHLIAQVEADPNSGSTRHTWDTLWSQLHTRWDGVLLGVVTDSSHKWITIGARRLGRMSPNFVLVDICVPMDGSMRRGRTEVGPVNMPVSNESLAVIDEAVGGRVKIHDVVFIGALYPYRVKLLDGLLAQGVHVAVNPHRADATRDFAESRTNQPSYLDYMTCLAQSHMVINFSDSSAGPFQQLKTRVLEASAVGCLVLTDDLDRTDRFWVPEEEYGYFATPAEIPVVVDRFLSEPPKLRAAQERARRRAREINVTSFWSGIEDVLHTRGLPSFATRTTRVADPR